MSSSNSNFIRNLTQEKIIQTRIIVAPTILQSTKLSYVGRPLSSSSLNTEGKTDFELRTSSWRRD